MSVCLSSIHSSLLIAHPYAPRRCIDHQDKDTHKNLSDLDFRDNIYKMPRFFDDYSNTYLTHDSSAGRKQQRRGWKFRENFRLHYEPYVEKWRRGPMGLASAQQAFLKVRGSSDPAVPPLPPGWKEQVDEVIGISYYIDTNTGKRSWVRPGFIPPPPGQGPPRWRPSR